LKGKYQGITILLELENLNKRRNAIIGNDLFKSIMEAYSKQLTVYDGKVRKNIFGLEFSDRELIANLLVHGLRRRGNDVVNIYIRLYNEKKLKYRKQKEFKILVEELNLAYVDENTQQCVWKDPTPIELYLTIRDIIPLHPSERDLIDVVGKTILKKYPIKEVEKYYTSYYNLY